ncbi:MAG TPA: PEP-CTERM sorting domain-containing protein [Candidatus Binatia bacterium]|nr:PEP-CTERM sorting domain-containing protein [Candidatus Binatia bacterium]
MKKHLRFGLSLPVILMAGSLFLLPEAASAAMTPTTAGPTFGIDDYNVSTLNPSPVIPVSTLVGAQCPWINSGLNNFVSSHPGWTYSWASQADMAKVEQGISILDYYSWVVKEPPVTDARGTNWTTPDPPLQGNNNVHDVGGATFNLKYTPVAGAHVFSDLHWIQGLDAYYDDYGYYDPTNFQVRLDLAAGNNTPFYDNGFAAGKLAGGGGWFLDTPFKIENEALETNPVADVQFQVVLADFNSATTNVTLYGGDWWGYKYTASDTLIPEPGALALLAVGGMTLLRRRRLPRWRR